MSALGEDREKNASSGRGGVGNENTTKRLSMDADGSACDQEGYSVTN
jgi:hypothetical protein